MMLPSNTSSSWGTTPRSDKTNTPLARYMIKRGISNCASSLSPYLQASQASRRHEFSGGKCEGCEGARVARGRGLRGGEGECTTLSQSKVRTGIEPSQQYSRMDVDDTSNCCCIEDIPEAPLPRDTCAIWPCLPQVIMAGGGGGRGKESRSSVQRTRAQAM